MIPIPTQVLTKTSYHGTCRSHWIHHPSSCLVTTTPIHPEKNQPQLPIYQAMTNIRVVIQREEEEEKSHIQLNVVVKIIMKEKFQIQNCKIYHHLQIKIYESIYGRKIRKESRKLITKETPITITKEKPRPITKETPRPITKDTNETPRP